MLDSFHMPATEPSTDTDSIESSLRGIAQNILVVVFGLLPILFVPVVYAPFAYTKVILVVFVVLISVVFYSLSVLRSGHLRLPLPWPLIAFWGVLAATVVAAALSGNPRMSFVGNTIGVQSAFFVILMAAVMTLPLLMRLNKATIIRLYIFLTGSAVILGLYHIARLILGAHFLSFGIFTSATSTPLGSWNDVGLFAGLCILLSLVALEQLPLTKWGRVLFSVVVGFSLVLLAVVNFFVVWLVLGFVSLVLLMYSLTKERFADKTAVLPTEKTERSASMSSIVISAVVFITSLIFIIGGASVGNFISKTAGVNYVEVRPSVQSTIDIGRAVYAHSALIGIGPNKFVDAWRLYKNPNINQTLFWSTDFNAGSGYLLTQFITTGLLGVVTWLLFLVLFVIAGARMVFRSAPGDRFWYFIGTSSFVASLYLWGMTMVYNPSTVTMLLTAIFTGIMFVAYSTLVGSRSVSISVSTNRRSAFALVGIVMVVIIASVTVLYYAGRNYSSVYAFNRAVSSVKADAGITQAEQEIASAYGITPNPTYTRQLASYQIYKLNQLLAVQKPTDAQKKQFQTDAAKGISAARLALQQDNSDPANWSVLGSLYSILAVAGVKDAKTQAQNAFEKAKQYDPHNPVYDLLEAQLDARTKDLNAARTAVKAAITLKQNYTDAFLLLSQIDIAEGKVKDAIATTQSVISLDPNNPARYYQLGVLEISDKNTDAAINAFEQAIKIDPNYANARYLLALSYLDKKETKPALEQLQYVLKLNPGNDHVTKLIQQVKAGTASTSLQTITAPITESTAVSQQNGAVTTTKAPNTSLVTPVNTVPSQDQQHTATTTGG